MESNHHLAVKEVIENQPCPANWTTDPKLRHYSAGEEFCFPGGENSRGTRAARRWQESNLLHGAATVGQYLPHLPRIRVVLMRPDTAVIRHLRGQGEDLNLRHRGYEPRKLPLLYPAK